jgi:hypothetical protein
VAMGLLMLVVVDAGPAGGNISWQERQDSLLGPRGATGDFEIYTINPDGEVGLTSPTTLRSTRPAYSPSGQQIAYAGEDGPNGDEIYTTNVGGGGRVQLTDNTQDDYEPSWGSG